MFGEHIKCSNIQRNIWYYFNGHIWERIDDGYVLSRHISVDLCQRFVEKMKEFLRKIETSTDSAHTAMYNTQLKKAQKAQLDCKQSPWKRNVMKEAREIFYEKDFDSKLNTNPMLFAFKNGIYDLDINKLRNGQPDDYCSINAPINYKEFMYADDRMLQCEEFFTKLFPDKTLREYFISTTAGKFVGGNSRKTFDIWTGSGDNGKSVVQALLEKIFGQMAIKMNTQYFTGRKVQNGGANPELFRAAPPVRHVTMDEPDGDEQLNNGELKKLTGNDTFIARDLFMKGTEMREMTPMFELTLICNQLPPIRHGDDATYRRIRVIPFESQFVDSGYPSTLEEQIIKKRFPKDREFGKKLPQIAEPMAFYLLNWRTVRGDSVTVPDKVLSATSEYKKGNDIYRQFSSELIKEEKTKRININELYSAFKEWYKEGFPSRVLPSKAEVKAYFIKMWGKPVNQTWKGYYYQPYIETHEDNDTDEDF